MTGFGLGRAEQKSVSNLVDPVLVIGVELRKALALASGTTSVFFSGAVPIYGRDSRPVGEKTLPGQIRLGISSVWQSQSAVRCGNLV